MHETLKNLYYVSFFALLLQFIGLYQPFAVLLGITFCYLAFAEVFMPEEIDRLRRMSSFSYRRRTDVSIAFIVMTVCFGAYHIALGFNSLRLLGPLLQWVLGLGSVAALYLFLHQYLPHSGQGGRGSGGGGRGRLRSM